MNKQKPVRFRGGFKSSISSLQHLFVIGKEKHCKTSSLPLLEFKK